MRSCWRCPACGLTDLLPVDGNPLEILGIVADPSRSFEVIMKDGRIYTNTLPG